MSDDDLESRGHEAEELGFDAEEAEGLAGGVAPDDVQRWFDSRRRGNADRENGDEDD